MSAPTSRRTTRYLPLVKIGSGAYATVYVALDRGPSGVRQLVAMKVLHPHLAEDPVQRESLVREARLLSSVRHANVVELKDVDVDDGVRLVVGYVEGVTLGRWLVELAARKERLDPRIVVQIGIDAAAGLHAIHEARSDLDRPLGLVHRDVSPQNLLVGVDGVSKLSDFGTAKVLFEPMSETTEGSLKGKLGYMAPEYIRGAKVDRRVDVFALGVVLWEAFTGKRLFRGQNEGETLDRVLRAEVPAPGEIDPALQPFDSLMARALARDPSQRLESALVLGQELQAAARRAGLETDHAAVGEAMGELFEPELRARRSVVAKEIAESDTAVASKHSLEEATSSKEPDDLEPPVEAAPGASGEGESIRSRSTLGSRARPTAAWVIGIGAALVVTAVGVAKVAERREATNVDASKPTSSVSAPPTSPPPTSASPTETGASSSESASAVGSRSATPASSASSNAGPSIATSSSAPTPEPQHSARASPRRPKPPPNPY